MALQVETRSDGVVIAVKVVPNASREQIVGLLGDALKIKVAQPPEAGKANKAVETLLARALGIPAGRVRVVGGQSQPHKRILLAGVDAVTAQRLIGE